MVVRQPMLRFRQPGFTLVEMMFVIVILAVLLSLAAPSFSELAKSQQVRSVAVDLHADITLARSEAIKRGAQVFIVARDTATAKDWAKGWDVSLASPVTTTSVLKSQDAFSGGVSATGATGLTIGRAGRPIASATTSFEVKHSDIDASKWRCVTVDLAGRPATKTGGCS